MAIMLRTLRLVRLSRVGLVVAAGLMFAGAGVANACTPHQCFINRVVSHLPYLHVDQTDGFRPQNFKLIFDYRALSTDTHPGFTCLRYSSNTFNDDRPCTSAWSGTGPAVLANVGYGSTVDHLDYPAPITGDCGKLAAIGQSCPEKALADKYWNGQPVIYFFGKRDSRNRKQYEYWFFYSYNYFVITQNLIVGKIQGEYDLHEGDLEHIIVYTNANDQPVAYRFYEHSGYTPYAATDGRLDTAGGHVRVYEGHGSHASEIRCGLFANQVPLGQRDRTCVKDPYTDNVLGSSATTTYSPSNTAISNLDVASWACFGHIDSSGAQHRLGQSHPDIGSGFNLNAPMAPLVQTGECPNLYERQHSAAAAAAVASAPAPARSAAVRAHTAGAMPIDLDGTADASTVEEPTADAYAGIDKCSDWEMPDPQVGLKVLACNQASLTQYLDASDQGLAPLAQSAPAVQSAVSQPTESVAPSYALAASPQELMSDTVTTPSSGTDVYVSQAMDTSDGTYELEALFPSVSSPTGSLHVDTTGIPWTLIDGDGNVIASATPDERGCPLPGSPVTPPQLSGIPVVCNGTSVPTDVRIAGHTVSWRLRGTSDRHTRLALVIVGDRHAERLRVLRPSTLSSRAGRYRAALRLPRGTRAVGIAATRLGRTSVSGLIRLSAASR